MKKLFSTTIALIISLLMQAQFANFDTLNVNNWAARINPCDIFFYDGGYSSLSEIPKYSGISSIFSSNFWIGGFDSNNSLHMSSEAYGGQGLTFSSGPYANNYSSTYDVKYNRVWKLNKYEVDYHINHWNDVGYVMPEAIENWPANGDISNGEDPVLAPFYDINANNFYDPQNGDYPYILGDQAIYLILNDGRNATYLDVPKMNLEIHAMVFAFQDTGVINNTFFMHFDIINKSQTNYHDVLWAFNSDFDIGGSSDDYIGCDSTQNVYFGYNGDSVDVVDSFDVGYGAYPPAVGITFLSREMTSFMYFNNGMSSTDDPYTGAEYYNYMHSLWKDSTHLQYGGNGHLTGGANVNYAFEENTSWTENITQNTPGDRRGVASITVGDLDSTNCFGADVAFVWARDTTDANPHSSVNLLLSQIPQVVQFASQIGINSTCTNLIYSSIKETDDIFKDYVKIYPNPANNLININTNYKNYKIEIFTQLGKKIIENENIKILDISNLSDGVYIIKISSNDKFTWDKLIVK